MATKYKTKEIAAAISSAAKHTKAVADFEGWDDGGTCNFDAPYLEAKGMTEAQADEIGRLSGVRCYILKSSLFGRILMVSGNLEGRGNRRTRMAEEMKKQLNFNGIGAICSEAHVWYQMD